MITGFFIIIIIIKNATVAMNSPSPRFSLIISSSSAIFIALFLLLLLLLFPSSYCLNQTQPPDPVKGLVVEEKTRLGSTPPSCHNKCNQCHPCMAVQVPTMPSHNRVDPSSTQLKRPDDYFDSSGGNRYSNYKPLGWKCRCGGHVYNP